MSIFTDIKSLLTKRDDTKFMYDINYMDEPGNKVYAKRMALDKVINFVARAASTTEFKVMDGFDVATDTLSKKWNYKLNVRPNTDSSAADFWQKLVYTLIKDNEVLVIANKTGDLLVADSYVRHESANYPDIFDGVIVKNYTFQRSFNMDEVWFMTYNNHELERFTDGLWSDYGRLFERLIEINLRNNQIRGTVKANMTSGAQDSNAKKLQSYINKLFQSFEKNSVAIVPITRDFEYNEVSGTVGEKNQSVAEIQSLIDSYTYDIANIIGVPPALIHGQMAEVDQNNKAFITYCYQPLIKKIRDELNAKIFYQADYDSGMHVKPIGLDQKDIYQLSENIDKLISSGTLNNNDVRRDFNLPPREGGDEYVITKNYTTKGGDNNDAD